MIQINEAEEYECIALLSMGGTLYVPMDMPIIKPERADSATLLEMKSISVLIYVSVSMTLIIHNALSFYIKDENVLGHPHLQVLLRFFRANFAIAAALDCYGG